MKQLIYVMIITICFYKTSYSQNPVLIKDIAPSTGPSSNPNNFAIVNNKLVFAANLYSGGSSVNRELMVSDGTSAGTQLLKDIMPGNNSSEPSAMITINNKTYFIISDNSSGILVLKPWVTDGTALGTYPLLKHPTARIDNNPGLYNPKHIFIAYQGLVYFSGYDTIPPYNNVIYQTDGTQQGTKIAIRLPNNNSLVPNNLTSPIAFLDKLFFCGGPNANGSNLYKYDTVLKAPVLIKNNVSMYEFRGHAIYNNKLYFSGSSPINFLNSTEPWVTDGTDSGTYEIQNLNANSGWGSEPIGFNVMNGKLYFFAYPILSPQFTTYLYAIDSTQADTIITPIKKISNSAVIYKDKDILKSNNLLYFMGNDSINGNELWVSDGTTLGTKSIDIISGSGSSTPYGFTEYCNEVYFTGVSNTGPYILYKSNGTLSGTSKVPGLVSNPNTPGIAIDRDKIVFNNKLFFGGQFDTNIGVELYAYDAQCNPVNIPKITSLLYELKIFPNPSDGLIYIHKKNRTMVNISIFDINGKEVLKHRFDEEKTSLDLAKQGKGFYYLKIQANNELQVMKLTLQ